MGRRIVAALIWAMVLAGTVSPAAGAEAVDSAGVAARLDRLTLEISGNVVERRAHLLVNYHRVEGGIEACMRDLGKPYQSHPYVDFYRDFTDADLGFGTGYGTVFDSLTDRGRIQALNEEAAARVWESGLYDYATPPAPGLDGCRERFGNRDYQDPEPPHPAVDQLSGFAELVTIVSRDPGVRDGMRHYPKCMKQRYGYDVPGERTDLLFAPRLDPPPNPGWDQAVAEIAAIHAADADCRRPAYDIAVRIVGEHLDGWEKRHRSELDAIRAAWRQRVSEAQRYHN
ncbi:hypothetical protein KZ829_08665 [Actinoplanes hulinensis]|uniref:Uncharacterized protein n=1 Tax=Actinoplanes hulinensis TaxID=1144547 RepID=A0ABS7AYN9_9ACTN|nr:hypothetical protein [Actinoplanes hulinensis]MBW6433807.1 hypothetical protein [Actinoplanes hulinensis]